MRRPMLYFAVLLGAGVLLSEYASGAHILWVGVAAAALGWILNRKRLWGGTAVGIAILALGWTRGDVARRKAADCIERIPVGYAVFYGRTLRSFKKHPFYWSSWVELDSATTGGRTFSISGRALLKATSDCARIAEGAHVRLAGRFKRVEWAVEHPGYLDYLRRNGVSHEIKAKSVHVLNDATIRAKFWKARRYFAAPLERRIDDLRARAVALALILGERSELDAELRQAYATGGAAHILALSGAHLMILALWVRRLTRFLTFLPGGRIAAVFATVGVLWFYALTTGAAPPVVRAAW
ncbi:MAG: ComEC/Rec2 family competence protein, partial [Bacteroidia bacterium]|nr:ComEC/Rec2 family competence protein [Bacteroidia bacterium]